MIKLPRELKDFGKHNYWEDFFRDLGDKPFEWYIEYADFANILSRYIHPTNKVLVVGCGNSDLSFHLNQNGISDITNIDIVDKVIEQCKHKYKNLGMKYIKMDACKMDFDDHSFDVILDKGTLDALAHDASNETYQHINAMWNEISRLVKPLVQNDKKNAISDNLEINSGGHYICISLAQKHILDMIGAFYFGKTTSNGGFHNNFKSKHLYLYSLRVYCLEKENEIFPVFVFVFTFGLASSHENEKNFTRFEAFDDYLFKNQSQSQNIERNNNDINMVCPSESNLYSVKFDGYDKLLDWIKYKQSIYVATKKDKFEKLSRDLGGAGGSDEEVKFDLYGSEEDRYPKYTLYLIKCREGDESYIDDGQHKFAVFIVPLGKENEWLFSTPKGRSTLLKSTGFKRLVIAHLNRNHSYPGGIESVKSELSPKINEYRSNDLALDEKIPFLSIGQDSLERRIVEKGFTGLLNDNEGETSPNPIEYQIEEVKLGNPPESSSSTSEEVGWYRRLYLLNTPSLIQSEIELKFVDGKLLPDINCPLSFEHHKAMVTSIGLNLFSNPTDYSDLRKMKILVVGLGGGVLPSFLVQHLPFLSIDVCEIDSIIADLAHRFFDFPKTPDVSCDGKSCINLHVGDGLEFLRELALKQPLNSSTEMLYDMILLDVNFFDPTDGLFSPPSNFLYPQNMKTLQESLNTTKGILLTTVLTRDSCEKVKVEESFRTFFPSSYYTALDIDLGEEELNKIISVEPKIKLSHDNVATGDISTLNLSDPLLIAYDKLIFCLKNSLPVERQQHFDALDYLVPLETITKSRIIY